MKSKKKTNFSELASLMFVMGRFMRDHMQKKMQKTRCPSLLHLETLRYVKEAGDPLMNDVAKRFRVTPPAATLLIDSLVKEKLLSRVVDKKDRRAVRVKLTPAGDRMLAQGVKDRLNELKKIFSVLTAEEQSALVGILKKIIKTRKA